MKLTRFSILLILGLAPEDRQATQAKQSRAQQNDNAGLRYGLALFALLRFVVTALATLRAGVRLGGHRREQRDAKNHS
jgi:hypothetical protein